MSSVVERVAALVGEYRGHVTPYDSDREIAEALARAGLLANAVDDPNHLETKESADS